MGSPLCDIATLAAKLGQENLRVFDCRFSLADAEAGRRAWQQGHVPGALYLDMNADLSSPHVPGQTGRHPLPSREDWLRRVQSWGLSPEVEVVAYDDSGGAGASRLWWLLRWIGHDRVAVLDGGWQAWLAAGQPVDTRPVALPRASSFDYANLPALAAAVTAAELDASRQTLLDARELPRFRGEVEPIDPVAGHIPGAFCSPFSANLELDGRFRSPQELRLKFAPVLGAGKPVVCYCGSGVTACHNILALELAGLPGAALYAGSWSEWITDPSRPVARGD